MNEPTTLGAVVTATIGDAKNVTLVRVDRVNEQYAHRPWRSVNVPRFALTEVFFSWDALSDVAVRFEGVKPEVPEPTAFGALVVADHVQRLGYGTVRQRFVRLEGRPGRANWRSDTGHWRRWESLSDVEVLFEGVQ